VFNKINSEQIRPLWSEALDVLQHAKYVTIVGYSLPQTDIYMQYFLRSAFGPNSDLQQITVFDPVLFKDGDPAGEGMRRRYRECFAPQFWNYICFRPHFEGGNDQSSRTIGVRQSGTEPSPGPFGTLLRNCARKPPADGSSTTHDMLPGNHCSRDVAFGNLSRRAFPGTLVIPWTPPARA